MEWITPKIDWVYSDYFNVGDYNRIKNNLLYLCEATGFVATLDSINIQYIPTTTFFHNVNSLVKDLYKFITGSNTDLRTNFYENEPAWTYYELNTIEGLILDMYNVLKYEKKIPFTLGGVNY